MVLVTRPALEARDWVSRLQHHGIAAAAVPLIAIGQPPSADAIFAARTRLPSARAAMFVSANAVRGFVRGACAWPRGVRAWATGPGTAEALAQASVPASLIDQPAADAAQFDSEALWERVSGQLRPGDTVLLVRGGEADGTPSGRDWLAQQVQERGAHIDVVVAYVRALPQWSPAEFALARAGAGDGGLWLFSSSEAVGNLQQLLPACDWSRALALATHPRVADAAHKLGFHEVSLCRPAFDAVLASIESRR